MALLFDQAVQAHQSGRLSEAEALYRKIIADEPKNFDALHLLGVVCSNSGRIGEAEQFFRSALLIDPNFPPCHANFGFCLFKQNRFNDALASFDKAIALFPRFAEAHFGRGNALRKLKRSNDAIAAYNNAIALKPNMAEPNAAMADVLTELKRYDEAIKFFDKALEINPNIEFARGQRLQCKMHVCNWSDLNKAVQTIEAEIQSGKRSGYPFGWQALSESERSLQLCARIWYKSRYPRPEAIYEWKGEQANWPNHKIRIGYVCGEFSDHATSRLIVGLLESHDKAKFEIIGFDTGEPDSSAVRARIVRSLDKIISIRNLDDASAAKTIHDEKIDILLNLNGYVGEERTRVFGYKPAPIQVSYLGFPGTLGADCIDYIIADRCILRPESKEFYDEKVVYLPHTYQPNDRNRETGEIEISRAECGLPPEGFVFCCFNNNYKITPSIFDSWMAILNRVENSVIWLLEDNKTAANNLKNEAKQRGVDPSRLVFAARMPQARHMARHRLADLFLDTLPCNAHTTASDALRMGLPLLTQIGQTFAGRVAASLLNAIGLPELIAQSREEYEAFAIELAQTPEKLLQIKKKLNENRLTMPLFDTVLYAKHLEAAYEAMYRRGQEKLLPDHIEIQPMAATGSPL